MLNQTKALRSGLIALSIFATLFVIYASLVPLRYTDLTWDEAVVRWQHIPWLNLSIENRADWVANGLLMLPPGFFAAGAIGFRRKSRIWIWLAAPVIVLALCGFVIAIELVQVYFPPRVVSQNDILAGMIGSFCGVMLWFLLGNWLADQIALFFQKRPGPQRWLFIGQASLLLLCLYNLLPLDLVLSWEEIHEKWLKGRIIFVPFQDFPSDIKSILKWSFSLGVASLRITPFALSASLCRSPQFALGVGALAAVTIEAVKVPIYSREFSTADVLASIVGVTLATKTSPLVLKSVLHLDRSFVWLSTAIAWCGIMTIAFLARFDDIVTDPQQLQERFSNILTVPFANAHNSREFEAGVNILLKLAAFGALAFLLCGWNSRRTLSPESTHPRSVPWRILAVSGALMGAGIEVGQVFLLPLVPDATDWISYSIGMLLGVGAFRLLIPNREILQREIQELLDARNAGS